MTVSILHRITGSGMATVGMVVLIAWLCALASGPEAYAKFMDCLTVDSGAPNALGYILGIGLTLSFFQHAATGIRHLFMDAGAGFELKSNRKFALLTMVSSVLLTVILWGWLITGHVAKNKAVAADAPVAAPASVEKN